MFFSILFSNSLNLLYTLANSIIVGPASGNNTEEEIFGQVEVWKET